MGDSPDSSGQGISHSDFGLRLADAMREYGPLCVQINPHRDILSDWGYRQDAEGAELFSMRMLQATNGRVAAVKLQTALFERYGSQGFEALERVLYVARQMGVITIIDCLQGGQNSDVGAMEDAYLRPDAPMRADAITIVPYYGMHALNGLIGAALDNGRGIFISSFTSNPEERIMQTAICQTGRHEGKTVAYGITSDAQSFNDGPGTSMGSVGLAVNGALGQWARVTGADIAHFSGPILACGRCPDDGPEDLGAVLGEARGNVLVTAAQPIASKGPDIAALSQAAESMALGIRQILLHGVRESEVRS
ncbi:MAG: orotidine-5'-phosphate decarboxylase [Bifidobacterium sp.]|jgi:orotidine-5'-phosphate decarboxylase